MATPIEFDTQNEQSMQALRLILAAWDEGEETGITPQMMAYSALFTALSDLIDIYGEDAVAAMAGGLEKRVRLGEFTMVYTRQ